MLIPDIDHRIQHGIVIKSHRVEVFVKSQRASTTVQQVFGNTTGRQLEATYLFPIPESASVADFTMWVNGREMSGEVVEANRARQIYTDIVRRTRDPGLLEYAGQDLFRARVFPVPPQGEIRIEVVYHQVLEFDAGLIEYRYGLSPTCARMNGRVGAFSFVARIEADQRIKSLYCPNYDVERRLRDRSGEVSYEGTGGDLTSDMVVFYSVSAEEIGMSLVCNKDGRRDGHFMLLVSPGEIERPGRVIAKDVVFVIDRSGSMSGDKIEQARDALRYCIDALNGQDRFGVITFATSVDRYESYLVDATRRQKRDAGEFVDKIRAKGGTDIEGALRTAIDMIEGDRPTYVVFLTDGLPTIGETDIRKIVAGTKDRNQARSRVFTFGVGNDVNTRLLDELADRNRGTVTYVGEEEDIEVKVSSFFAKVSEPVLADIKLDFGDVRVADVYPKVLPDLFNGSQLVVTGRFEEGRRTSAQLAGVVDGEIVTIDFDADFSRQERDFEFVPRLWATRKIAYLVEEIRRRGQDRELVDEVIELASRYGIVTPYTSYLILEDEDRNQIGRAFDYYQGRPDAMSPTSPSAAGQRSWDSVKSGLAKTSGKAAVETSRDIADAKRQDVVDRPDDQLVRYVGAKTFLFDGEVWTDAEFEPGMTVTQIEFLTDAYFELLARHPEVANYLALGERVIFVNNGHAYRVKTS